MIDEYLQYFVQTLVTDYNDPTFTVVISSLDIGEECDHETLTFGLKQYNPSVYDLLKEFYKDIMELTPSTEEDLKSIDDEASIVVEDFLNSKVTINNRKLILRSGLEYENDRKLYRSVLNASLIDSLPGSESRIKTVITSDDSDVFVFNLNEDICIPLYLKTNYNEAIEKGILMITLMNHTRTKNILENKVILVTDRNGHALYYPTALPTYDDVQDYISGSTDSNSNSFYNASSYFINDGVPRYLYYIRVDYQGTEKYEPFSKEFEIYIAKGPKTNVDTTGGS